MDYYGFYIGEEFEAYKYLGAHLNADGVTFRTFAPNAVKISVIGEFNSWTETPMNKVYDGNFWECSITGAKSGDMYKYRIYKRRHIYRSLRPLRLLCRASPRYRFKSF